MSSASALHGLGSRVPARRGGRVPALLVAPAARAAYVALVALVALAYALPAAATPGNAFLVLSPAPAAGGFDAVAFLTDPSAFSARALEHANGWSIAYTAQSPPPGWTRPFLLRGGGMAGDGAGRHPRYALAIEEFLAGRRAGMVALLDAPDTAACAPGKPNPHPFQRDGWLFLHDGALDIESLTNGIWNAPRGSEWAAFKTAHPRDYDGSGDSTRGNASEVYFLALLYEISRQASVPLAVRHTLMHFAQLPGFEEHSFNAILQGEDATWALRWAGADASRYRIFYTRTLAGEYCITDSLPAAGPGWQELPDLTLARFPFGGEVELTPVSLAPAGVDDPDGGDPVHDGTWTDDPRHDARAPGLRVASAPAVGELRLRCRVPAGESGLLEIRDVQGRRLARISLSQGTREIAWEPPPQVRSGLLWISLQAGGRSAAQRTLLIR
jgi:hypothetical protein